MVLAAVIALWISAPAPPQEPLALEQWEACAIGTSDKCLISREAQNWRNCMEGVSPVRGREAWEACITVGFPECYLAEAPEDVEYLLRLCSAKEVVATRRIVATWIEGLQPFAGPDEKRLLAELVAKTEMFAGQDVPNEPLMASAHRSGTWGFLLWALAIIREAVLTDGKSLSDLESYY